jgi:hypothetical protein
MQKPPIPMHTNNVMENARTAAGLNRSASARAGTMRIVAIALAAALAAAVVAGCTTGDNSDLGGDDVSDLGTGEPLPAPNATVNITYVHKGDSTDRASVTKFFAAQILLTREISGGRSASLVRFDGGVPIWQIKSDRSLIGEISSLAGTTWAVRQIEYGKVPAHFMQIIPDEGPPEPLDRGGYYVFEVQRASGSDSFQAVKVLADGSLEAYNAQPRAGNSFLLCCNVAASFPEQVVVPDQNAGEDVGGDQGDTEGAPSENSPADSPN